MSSSQQRDIILRRRARFIASAVGLSLGASPANARADEAETATPPKESDGHAVVAQNISVRCFSENEVSVHKVREVEDALKLADTLRQKNDREGARKAIEQARSLAFIPAVAEAEARFHIEDGRLAAARAALEGRLRCNAPPSDAVQKQLESLRERTATIKIGSSGAIKVDGAQIAPSGPVEIYVDAGSHEIEISSFEGTIVKRTLAFAGGEIEQIDIDNGEPRVCLSVCLSPPWRDREEKGPLGITLGPSGYVDIAGGDQATSETNPLVFGVTISPFLRVAGGKWIEARGGVLVAPSGSANGFTMPVGGVASVRIYTPISISFGVGVASGYLVRPTPSHSTRGVFEPAPSVFIEPHIPIAVAVGPIEIENRLGLMWSGQEALEGSRVGPPFVTRFGPSFFTLTIGFTYIPQKSRHEDMAVVRTRTLRAKR